MSAIKSWSAEAGHLEPDDVIISADVDEVLSSRQSEHQIYEKSLGSLPHCPAPPPALWTRCARGAWSNHQPLW